MNRNMAPAVLFARTMRGVQRFRTYLVFVVCFVATVAVAGAATNEVAHGVVPGSAIPSFSPWRPVGALLIVLGVLWLAARFLKGRVLPLAGMGKVKRLQMVEKLAVSPKQALVLVRVDDRELLIGVSEGRMESLTEVEPMDRTVVDERDTRP